MLRRCGSVWLGSYVVNQRLVVDWWQPFYRDDVHTAAKRRLKELEDSDWFHKYMRGSTTSGGHGGAGATPPSSSSDAAVQKVGEERDETVSRVVGDGASWEEGEQAVLLAAGGYPQPHDNAGNTTTDDDNTNRHDDHQRDDATAPLEGWADSTPPMHLFEANALVTTFTNQRNAEGLSRILAYIREGLRQELTPFHYHAMLRTFACNQERDEAVQVLEVMMEEHQEEEAHGEGEDGVAEAQEGPRRTSSSVFTLETYARAMDVLHCISPEDVLPRLLQAVALAQDSHRRAVPSFPSSESHDTTTEDSTPREIGVLWCRDVAGSEGATVAGFSMSGGLEGQLAAQDPHVMPGPFDDAEEEAQSEHQHPCGGGGGGGGVGVATASSPPLISLLHHVSNSPRYSLLASLLVALWIRSFGLALGDWEYFFLLSAAVTKRSTFPFVQWCVGSIPNTTHTKTTTTTDNNDSGEERMGVVTPRAVLERLEERKATLLQERRDYGLSGGGEGLTPSASSGGGLRRRRHASSSGSAWRRSGSATSSTAPGGWEELEALTPLWEAMRDSLVRGGVSLDAPVDMWPWLNSGCGMWQHFVDNILRAAEGGGGESREAAGDPVLDGAGDTVTRSPPAHSLAEENAASLLSSSPSSTAGGLGPHKYNPAGIHHALTLLLSATRDDTAAVENFCRTVEGEERWRRRWHASGGEHGEPFNISLHHLVDVGSLVDRVSARTLNEIREPFMDKAKGISARASTARQEAELLRMSARGVQNTSYRDAVAGSDPAPLCAALSLATPLLVPSPADVTSCESFAIAMLESVEEAEAALQHAIELTSASHSHQPRHVRLLYKQVAMFCARHPIRNPKLSAVGLAERRKWALYLEARDVALALFGSTKRAREVMKHVYYNENTLPTLRSDSVIRQDVAEVRALLFPSPTIDVSASAGTSHLSRDSGTGEDNTTTTDWNFFSGNRSSDKAGDAEAAVSADSPTPTSPSGIPLLHFDDNASSSSSSAPISSAEYQNFFSSIGVSTSRMSPPHLRCSDALVPRYLYDPEVYNPYPHVHLRIPAREVMPGAAIKKKKNKDSSSSLLDSGNNHTGTGEAGDLFVKLWNTLMNTSIMGKDVWFLKNTDMFLLLLRCLLHRLDWESAAEWTLRLREHSTFTYKMDQALTDFFREIGDPAGCLAFKAATKLFDGRIVYEGQEKRRKFHERNERLGEEEEGRQ